MAYNVEVLTSSKGKVRMKEFSSRISAERFAKGQLRKGKAIVVDRVTRNSQSPVIQRGLQNVGFKGQFGKDFGRFSKSSSKPARKRIESSLSRERRLLGF